MKTHLSQLQTSNVLLSQAAARQVPSTLEDFTSVFGMGTGVAPPPSSLDRSYNIFPLDIGPRSLALPAGCLRENFIFANVYTAYILNT